MILVVMCIQGKAPLALENTSFAGILELPAIWGQEGDVERTVARSISLQCHLAGHFVVFGHR